MSLFVCYSIYILSLMANRSANITRVQFPIFVRLLSTINIHTHQIGHILTESKRSNIIWMVLFPLAFVMRFSFMETFIFHFDMHLSLPFNVHYILRFITCIAKQWLIQARLLHSANSFLISSLFDLFMWRSGLFGRNWPCLWVCRMFLWAII